MSNDIKHDVPVTEEDIHQAFDDSLFTIVYQPQVSLNDINKVFSLEAFVRFQHPKLGTIGPPSFLPLVDKLGLELKLTEYVLAQVAEHWRQLKDIDHDLNFAVNIESNILQSEGFLNSIESAIKQHGMPAQAMTIEICNCDFTNMEDSLRKRLVALHMKGFTLSLNNFEDASNAIAMLKELPINEIKVRTNVVAQLSTHAYAQTAFRKAVYLSQQYGIRIVAVGIEHRKEVDWLHRQGCDRGQGYLFGQPMAIDSLPKFLSGDAQVQVRQKQSLKLLIVEDDPQYRTLLEESLTDLYTVFACGSANEAEKLFAKEEPELIILDVNLPDGTGIDLCLDLNIDYEGQFSALFVSGSEDPLHKLQAYEVGAIDFLQKPCPFNELVAKVGHVAAFHKKRHELEDNSDAAQQAAVLSLREAAYYGDIIQFFKNLLVCRDEETIAKQVFSFMQQKGLLCSVQFRNTETISSFSQNDAVCSPIEIDVFKLLYEKGRIYEFGERAIFNDDHISILIKLMPKSSEERGRVRDYAAVILEGVEARYKDILRHRILQTVFEKLQDLATDLVDVIKNELESKKKLVDKFSLELGMSFHVLGLTIEQEEHITKIIEKMLSEQEDSEVSANDIQEHLSDIMSVLSTAIDNLSSASQEEALNTEKPIELF